MAPIASDAAFRPRKIRRADQSDLAVVQGISADAYIAAYAPALGYIPLPAEEDYSRRIDRGEVWLLACRDSDVGVVVLEERRDHVLVYSIAVRPTEQGRGHGRALLDFADRRAIALGLAVIRLYTNVRMEKNIALYRRHGYVETGTRPHPSRAGEVLVDMMRPVPRSSSLRGC
jgi:ribosomal protein S18 acetylase RimI-like enzyme